MSYKLKNEKKILIVCNDEFHDNFLKLCHFYHEKPSQLVRKLILENWELNKHLIK